jgi:cell wall assembly regulator SMI1
MSDDARAMPIDDLELSVRTASFLQTLGVKTVGELLTLPTFDIPATTPAKMSGLMRAELKELIAELGLPWPWSDPAPRKADKTATGDVAARWKTIAAWLADEHPEALEQFNPPATEAAIAKAEKDLGVTLPEDYKAFLRIHNGQDEFAPWVGIGALLPVEKLKVATEHIFGEDTPVPDSATVGDGVRRVEYSKGWIPITASARGRENQCIDLDPAPGGTKGQIVEYVADDWSRPLLATSFADLLAKFFEKSQTGDVDFDRFDDDDDDE